MNRDEEFEKLIKEYRDTPVPQNASDVMREAVARAQKQAAKRRRRAHIGTFGACAAAALALFSVLLISQKSRVLREENQENGVEEPYAENRSAQEESYAYACAGEGNAAGAVYDGGEDFDGNAANLKEAITEYADEPMTAEDFTERALECFEEEMSLQKVEFTLTEYDVLTDNDNWFTLTVYAQESGGEERRLCRYYNIDKASCEVVTLAELCGGADGLGEIRQEILDRLSEKSPLLEEDQTLNISEDQNYYFNTDGELVIVVEEYGSEFAISAVPAQPVR